MLVSYLKSLIFNVITSLSARASFFYSLYVFAPELEELKGKLASLSLESSAMQMYPIEFEKVGQRHLRCTLCRSHRQTGGWVLAGSCTHICRCFQKMSSPPLHLWLLCDPNLCYSSTHSWNRACLYSVFTVITPKGLDIFFLEMYILFVKIAKRTLQSVSSCGTDLFLCGPMWELH